MNVRPFVLTWLALLFLLAITVSASFVATGPASLVIAMAIAMGKAVLIGWFFMKLRRESGLVRLAALAGVAWLGMLFIFLTLDYANRI
jgi:cytochrome c oxidase subunit 4